MSYHSDEEMEMETELREEKREQDRETLRKVLQLIEGYSLARFGITIDCDPDHYDDDCLDHIREVLEKRH